MPSLENWGGGLRSFMASQLYPHAKVLPTHTHTYMHTDKHVIQPNEKHILYYSSMSPPHEPILCNLSSFFPCVFLLTHIMLTSCSLMGPTTYMPVCFRWRFNSESRKDWDSSKLTNPVCTCKQTPRPVSQRCMIYMYT